MKSTFSKISWMLKQAKNTRFFLSLIVISGILASLIGVYRAVLLKNLIDSATSHKSDIMLYSIILLAILIIGEIAIRGFSSMLTTYSSNSICNTLQQNVYSHLLSSKLSEFSKHDSGDILTRMTSDIDNVSNLLVNILPDILSLIILVIASFFTLFAYDSTLAILIIIISPIPILLSRFLSIKIKKLYTKLQETESKYRLLLNESVQNIEVIKSFCLENNHNARLKAIQNNKLKLSLKRNRISIISNSVLSLGYWICFFLAFSWGAFKLSKGMSTFGTLTAILQLVGNIQAPFTSLAYALPQLIAAIASGERIIQLEKLGTDPVLPICAGLSSAGIEFKNINFSYEKNIPVLTDISAVINPGEITAIIGPSGEGKTTLVKLLLSLYQSDNGHIYTTDKDNKYEISASSRKFISYVPQGNTLFSGSIAENLRNGCQNASDKELEAAARAACAWEFIENSQNGLNTIIGEHGTGLSEGQAQRIAIARALLKKAPVLILDEATSALDADTELKVLTAIKTLQPPRTCIVITHRVSALKICSRIFKIENKHLVECTDLPLKQFNIT